MKINKNYRGTRRDENEPKAMVQNLPMNASETKAPITGAKLEAADQILRSVAALTWFMWYSFCKYTIKFAINPKDANLSNVSFPALRKSHTFFTTLTNHKYVTQPPAEMPLHFYIEEGERGAPKTKGIAFHPAGFLWCVFVCCKSAAPISSSDGEKEPQVPDIFVQENESSHHIDPRLVGFYM